MKTHAKQFPTFWTGATARQLAGSGPFTRLIADYFISAPAAIAGDNYGLYYVERESIRKHVEVDDDTLDRAVELLARVQFAFWDTATEWVFVREAAAWQYHTPLLPRDFTCANARRFYRQLPKNPWLAWWFDRYYIDFCLQHDPDDERQWVERREWAGPTPEICAHIPPPAPRAAPAPAPKAPQTKLDPAVFVDRILRRLSALRMNGEIGTAVGVAIKQLRDGVVLPVVERRLLDVVIAELGDQVNQEARETVASFRGRMSSEQYETTYKKAVDDAARRIANLPVFQE